MSYQVSRDKIYVLGDEMTCLGLKLAGIGNTINVSDSAEAGSYLAKLAKEETIAIIIVTESIAQENRQIINRILLRPWPVVIEIPGPEGPLEMKSSTLGDLVKSALGIELNI